ncbi:MAG: dynamin family protein [Hyphomicrobiales bacterium]|nr:dynamin family protein [Hyphomicrobiales bacterium]
MFGGPGKAISERLSNLEDHLRVEHPELLEVVGTYRDLDRVLYGMGLLSNEESLATRIPWFPLIAILGTFSSGKSTFINHYVNEKLQSTGNQAVDDKFTVICYGPEEQRRTLPGTALDADPRFPFFGMSDEIDKVAAGEGKRIDSYLQLKTTPSAAVKGKILIDSPGFDADDQRRSILRLTDHIVDLADLVLILFDARHPEPGAMQDTLEHLVKGTVNRTDARKFLYILNQIDTAAREDNPEEVVAAWQRAVAQAGLSSGPFFTIYNERAAVPIEDVALRRRFESKRDRDLAEIGRRIDDVEMERSYRIVRVLETVLNEIESEALPALRRALTRWRKRTVIGDLVWAGVVVAGMAVWFYLRGLDGYLSAWHTLREYAPAHLVAAAVLVLAGFGLHLAVRQGAAKSVAASLPDKAGQMGLNLRAAFLRNTPGWRSQYRPDPVGWGRRTGKRLKEIRQSLARHVQRFNDLYTDPSGRRAAARAAAVAAEAEAPPATAVTADSGKEPENRE